MSALPVRELIERKLDNLTEEQLSNLLDYIEMVGNPFTNDEYDESLNATDAGQRTKDILRAES